MFCIKNQQLMQKRFANAIKYLYDSSHGSVAERFNAPVLKTDEGLYPSVSSNLTASAKFKNPQSLIGDFFLLVDFLDNL